MIFNLPDIFKSVGIDVLEMIELVQWDHDMNSLRQYLSKYREKEFATNERLVFINDDTEYIIDDLRFNMYNLQSLIASLNIPNYFCIVIGQSDVSLCLQLLRKSLTNDPYPISNVVFQGHIYTYQPPTTKIDINDSIIDRNYVFLNNVKRSHRTYMISWLAHYGLLDKGYVSFNKSNKEHLRPQYVAETNFDDDNYKFVTLQPYTNNNDKWICDDRELLDIFRFELPKFKNFSEDEKVKITSNNHELLQKAFLYVSSETVFNYPDPYMSEKSFKSFSAMRPMLMLGAQGSLSRIRSLGFETWFNFWDESYDDIKNPTDRFKTVANLIKYISSIGLNDLRKMLSEMEPILIHNRDLYTDRFVAMQIEHIRSQLLTILKR